MFEKEKYSFSTTGVAIIPEVLHRDRLARAIAAVEDRWPGGGQWKFPVLHLDRVFWDMMTHPTVLEFCREFTGEHFRMDHAFGVSGDAAQRQMHGGPYSSQHSCFCLPIPGGSSFVGQLNIGFTLHGQSPETGGFCYVPGSHRSTDPRAGAELLEEVYDHDFNHHSIVVPTLWPGDLMVFTEALVHGDTGQNKSHVPTTRTQIYYKMTPGFMCWRDPEENKKYLGYAKTELERKMLEPPWTGRYSEDANSMGITNERREGTLDGCDGF
jgi:hypothetical protein